MTGSAVLDTVLGMVFLFYALALVCGGLVEMIANWVKKRAKYLLRGIRRSRPPGRRHRRRARYTEKDHR
jgi:hypothetical protein